MNWLFIFCTTPLNGEPLRNMVQGGLPSLITHGTGQILLVMYLHGLAVTKCVFSLESKLTNKMKEVIK